MSSRWFAQTTYSLFASSLKSRLAITQDPRHLLVNRLHQPVMQGASHIFVYQMAERVDYAISISSDPSSDFIPSDSSSGTTLHSSDSDKDQRVRNVTGIVYEGQREVTSLGMYLSTRIGSQRVLTCVTQTRAVTHRYWTSSQTISC